MSTVVRNHKIKGSSMSIIDPSDEKEDKLLKHRVEIEYITFIQQNYPESLNILTIYNAII
jgi:hypothetical protein